MRAPGLQPLGLGVIVSLCQLLPMPAHTATPLGAQARAGGQAAVVDTVSSAWERHKFEQTMLLEQERLSVERTRTLVMSISTVFPLVLGLLTIALGVWSLRRQIKEQATARDREAGVQFELKAAELVLSSSSPGQAKTRARALKALLGDRLPAAFVESFRLEDFAEAEPLEIK